MVVISASDNENVAGICVHSKNIYFDFEYKTNGTPQSYKEDFLIYFYSEESIACKPKSDDIYSDAKVGDIISTAKDSDYQNILFTTTPQNPGAVTIKQAGEWYVEKICDPCCKEFKQKTFNQTQQTVVLGSGGSWPMPRSVRDGTSLEQNIDDSIYSAAYQRILSAHPIIFKKIMDMIRSQANQFNQNGYLNGRNAKENLSNALSQKSREIEANIINSLGCAGTSEVCPSCDGLPCIQYDPTYKTENDVILELNYKTQVVTNYGTQVDSIKLVDLNFNKNSSWVNNI